MGQVLRNIGGGGGGDGHQVKLLGLWALVWRPGEDHWSIDFCFLKQGFKELSIANPSPEDLKYK